MNIPAVIGLGEALLPDYDGKIAAIDGLPESSILSGR